MFKNILVPLLNSTADPRALKLAAETARMSGGHIDCLFVHPDASEVSQYMTPMGPETAAYSGQLVENILEADKQCAVRARQIYDAFCAGERLDHQGPVTASWCEASGNSAGEAVRQGFYHDLIVLGRPPGEDLTLTGAIDVLAGSGRPVLLAPNAPVPDKLTNIVIAWKESPQAARAVSAALPLLERASKIDIICVAESAEDGNGALHAAEMLAEHLRGHGLRPQAGHVLANGRATEDVLIEAAAEKLNGSLLVMGAYQHSRAHEFVFGGVTRHVLHNAPIPILLAH